MGGKKRIARSREGKKSCREKSTPEEDRLESAEVPRRSRKKKRGLLPAMSASKSNDRERGGVLCRADGKEWGGYLLTPRSRSGEGVSL